MIVRAAPAIMRMTPTVPRSTPLTASVTAYFRIAPTASRKTPVPIHMDAGVPGVDNYHLRHADRVNRSLRHPAGASGLPRHDQADRTGADPAAGGRDRRDRRVP